MVKFCCWEIWVLVMVCVYQVGCCMVGKDGVGGLCFVVQYWLVGNVIVLFDQCWQWVGLVDDDIVEMLYFVIDWVVVSVDQEMCVIFVFIFCMVGEMDFFDQIEWKIVQIYEWFEVVVY